ncbi:MAG: cohesin domain-containing protein [Dehalococcoidia bacterium]
MLLAVAASTVLALAASMFFAPAEAQTGPSLAFDAGGSEECVSVDEGDEIEVSLLISGAQSLQSWEATITYDRDVLEITQHNTALFLAGDPNSSLIDASEPLPDVNGRHLLSTGDLRSTASESGNGVLGTITFRALGAGVSVIDVPQRDLNGDGRVDEGAALTTQGGVHVNDVNFDGFFDGPVQSAVVAVEASCAAVTPKPTDPPTPAPNFTTAPGGSPGDPNGTGGSSDGDTPAPGESAEPGESPGPGDGSSTPVQSGVATDGPGGPTNGPANQNGTDDGGSSFPAWLVVALIGAALAAGSGAVLIAMRRSSRGSAF